jgi:CPA2 family monovalent cation:H+ antiporter-2
LHEFSVFHQLLGFLLAPVLVVPLFRRLRSSATVGYLVAGILIGPQLLGVIVESELTNLLAELGVAFLLFAVGLELSLARLKVMRRLVFGLGALQVVLTACVIGVIAVMLGAKLGAAIVVGSALALSSTAFVLQLLVERGEQVTRFGRATVAILLFQDLAVVPLLVLVPALAPDRGSVALTLGISLVKAGAALVLIIAIGRFVLRPVFRMVAATRSPELFVSATLLVVVGMGWLAVQAGLPMPLGAFLAGLLLSETEYRHQVEADIRPFRGLLLGLFFMTVGLSMDLGVVSERPTEVAVVVLGLLTAKVALIFVLCLAFRLPAEEALRVGFLLAQGGEFGFVLFDVATARGVLLAADGQMLTAVVALSMIVTPFLSQIGGFLAARMSHPSEAGLQTLREETAALRDHVVVAGFGRVGQTVAKVLAGADVPYVALDLDVKRIARARADHLPVFYGDAARVDVLAAAGAGRARAVVLTIDQPQVIDRAVAALRSHFAELRIFVRGRDLEHGRRLTDAGATAVVPEAVEASLQLGVLVLDALGTGAEAAARVVHELRQEDYAALREITGVQERGAQSALRAPR